MSIHMYHLLTWMTPLRLLPRSKLQQRLMREKMIDYIYWGMSRKQKYQTGKKKKRLEPLSLCSDPKKAKKNENIKKNINWIKIREKMIFFFVSLKVMKNVEKREKITLPHIYEIEWILFFFFFSPNFSWFPPSNDTRKIRSISIFFSFYFPNSKRNLKVWVQISQMHFLVLWNPLVIFVIINV